MPLSRAECYELLGVSAESSEDEVRSAYKRLALRTHPDKNPNDPEAHAKFLKISEAYKRLSDPESFRDEDDSDENVSADQMQEMFESMFASMFAPAFHFSGPYAGRRGGMGRGGVIDLNDILEMMGFDEEEEDDEYDDDEYYYDEDEEDEDEDEYYLYGDEYDEDEYDDDDDEYDDEELDMMEMMMEDPRLVEYMMGGVGGVGTGAFMDHIFASHGHSSTGSGGRGRGTKTAATRPSLYSKHKKGGVKSTSTSTNQNRAADSSRGGARNKSNKNSSSTDKGSKTKFKSGPTTQSSLHHTATTSSSSSSSSSSSAPATATASTSVTDEEPVSQRRRFKPHPLPRRKSLYKKRRTASEGASSKETSGSHPSHASSQVASSARGSDNNDEWRRPSRVNKTPHKDSTNESRKKQHNRKPSDSSKSEKDQPKQRGQAKGNQKESTYFDEPDSSDDDV